VKALRLPQALPVSNQATLGRLGIVQVSFPLALRFELHARLVAIDELDASGFECALHGLNFVRVVTSPASLETSHGRDCNPCRVGKLHRCPIKQRSGGSTLRRDHFRLPFAFRNLPAALYQRFITPVSRAASSSAPAISNTHAEPIGHSASFLCPELHTAAILIEGTRRRRPQGGAEGLAAGSEFQMRGEAPGSLEDKFGVALASPREQYLAAVLNIPTKARPHDAAGRPRALTLDRPYLTKLNGKDKKHSTWLKTQRRRLATCTIAA